MPGVSRKRICASGSVRIPRMRCHVVWGLGDTMQSFWPTSRFIRVDLPTFGLPMIAA
jgi:hypothetical protein